MDRTPQHSDGMLLSQEEYEAVHAAVSAGAGRWAGGQPCTLNSLLTRWSDVVAELEEGYSKCAPELDNDIWCRSALARVWPLLPPRVQFIQQSALHELDGRFRAATIQWPGRGRKRASGGSGASLDCLRVKPEKAANGVGPPAGT